MFGGTVSDRISWLFLKVKKDIDLIFVLHIGIYKLNQLSLGKSNDVEMKKMKVI